MIYERMLLAVEHLLPRIYQHPFNTELYLGTLDKAVFNRFLEQDKIYLQGFANSLRVTSSNMKPEYKPLFQRLALDASNEAERVHKEYLSCGFFVVPHITIPAISEYTYFLHKMASRSSGEAVGAHMPCYCFWAELGKQMMAKGVSETNPYRLWIEAYTDKDFLQAQEAIIHTANEIASNVSPEEQARMIAAFVKATTYEIGFWDAMYYEEAVQNQLAATCS